MDRLLIDYLPDAIGRMREIRMVMAEEQPELEAVWQGAQGALNDQFVQSATANGVARWERILHIAPKGTEDLDARKFRILTRLNEQLPYTTRTLEGQLMTLCGEDGYSVEVRGAEYTLIIRIALTAKSNFEDVEKLLHRVVPANMLIDLALKYNQYLTLKSFTHAQLARYTHKELRNEVLTSG